MKGSDLPEDVKQEVLKHIEQQAGATEYDRIVQAVGEDKLLDMWLASQSAGTPKRRETRGFWEKYGWWVAGICILFGWSPYWIGFQVIAIILSIITIVRWFNDRGIGIGKLLGGLLGFGLAYLIGLGFLGGGSEWWQHVFALPIGMLWLWLMSR